MRGLLGKDPLMKRNLAPLLTLLALPALPALPAAAAEPRPLFTYLDGGKRAAAPEPGVAAQRPIRVDSSALDGNPRLTLLDGTVYDTRKTGIERRGDADFTWR